MKHLFQPFNNFQGYGITPLSFGKTSMMVPMHILDTIIMLQSIGYEICDSSLIQAGEVFSHVIPIKVSPGTTLYAGRGKK